MCYVRSSPERICTRCVTESFPNGPIPIHPYSGTPQSTLAMCLKENNILCRRTPLERAVQKIYSRGQ